MITPQDTKRLTESTDRRTLTLYFNTRPDQPRSAYVARFRSLLRNVESTVPAEDRKQYDQVVAKLTNFLSQYQPEFILHFLQRFGAIASHTGKDNGDGVFTLVFSQCT